MSDHQDSDERAELARVNEQLRRSLDRCRFMLADARAKLAANSNDKESPAAEGDEKSADAE